MATIVERKLLQALEDVYMAVDDSKSSIVAAVDSLDIHVSNEDVVAALSNVLTAILSQSPVVKSSSTLITEITAAQWAIAQAQVGAANQWVLMAAGNTSRKGFAAYNNSTNSCYLQTSTSPNSQFAQLASNAGPTAHFQMFGPLVYTGPIYGRRNAGTGGGWCVEFI